MDPSAAPPWRVFDAPAPTPGAPTGTASAAAQGTEAGSARPSGLGVILADRRLVIAGGLAVAAVALALAAGFGAGAIGGDVTLDPMGGRPLGSAAGLAGSMVPTGELVVDVAGAVLRPGVYHLGAGSRVGDAIAAAGGYSPRVAADVVARNLNLAAVLHDGDRVLVPSRDDPQASAGAAGSGGGGGGSGTGGSLVDLNQASADALDGLPGIGPVTVAKIIASRTETPFVAVDDLLTRKLVSQKVFDQIRSLVTVR